MDAKKLKEFIELAKEYGVTKLKYRENDEFYSVDFSNDKLFSLNTSNSEFSKDDNSFHQANEKFQKELTSDENLLRVTSPFVGTFYRSPSPESSNYVKKGDHVNEGQIICIVEAMKIMNEIESDVSGELIKICVENETYVEYGQTLFLIKPH